MDYFLFNFSGVQFHYTMSQEKKSKKFFKNIYFVCLTFTLKKAISKVRGKNNTLPPLAQSRIRICK